MELDRVELLVGLGLASLWLERVVFTCQGSVLLDPGAVYLRLLDSVWPVGVVYSFLYVCSRLAQLILGGERVLG